jgi:hypothetical protein
MKCWLAAAGCGRRTFLAAASAHLVWCGTVGTSECRYEHECATRRYVSERGWKDPACGLSQQVAEAEGSLILEAQGRAGSSSYNDGTGRYCQTVWVRQARREGVTQVNQWLNPLKVATGSNLVDVGRVAAHAVCEVLQVATPKPVSCAGGEVPGNACGVPGARLQGNSWALSLSIGAW